MKKKDLNEIARLEKAIKEKYGEEAIQNPKKGWDKEKEKKYLEELKSFHEKSQRQTKIQEVEGFLIKQRKSQHPEERTCPICSSYSSSLNDDVYMTKFYCCYKCFIQYVEGREARWNSGWRPNN